MVLARKTQVVLMGTLILGASCFLHATPKTKKHHTKRPAIQPASQKVTTTSSAGTAHHTRRRSKKRKRGQQAIDGDRARQIQQALVREHYLKGTPSGTWDASTQEAMRRYQADQGWQTKEVPDSRALIRLGLGPDNGHLLNPESAMTSTPQLPHGAATAHATASSSGGNATVLPANTPASAPAAAAPDLTPSR